LTPVATPKWTIPFHKASAFKVLRKWQSPVRTSLIKLVLVVSVGEQDLWSTVNRLYCSMVAHIHASNTTIIEGLQVNNIKC
jgi:hypothetical protein